ncbi:type VII secretion target [Amycolatopsis sp. NPDC049253]|uniref:type VII secretion target n=1 Tax=Amycolatopsis sp. NPDC049253 TaxID=3155274 RepID=UPI00342E3FD8
MAGTQQVNLTALQAHKGEVQDIGEGVKTAAEATGSAQAFGDSSFGLVGQVFALPLQAYLSIASAFIGQVASSADDIADKLQQAHDHYDTNEQGTKDKVTSFGKELPA